MKKILAMIGVVLISCNGGAAPVSADRPSHLPGIHNWKTDWSRASVNLRELRGGGPGRDGIPPLEFPRWVSTSEASLPPGEPVVAVVIGGEARAYPLRILVWHEIVNDIVGGVPVAVTFCPLTHSAIVFDRRVEGSTLSFGVSGLLRKSNMVMWDRESESLWQQFVGEGIVGRRTGARLTALPSALVSFADFRAQHPDGQVQSEKTGHSRPYGRNPYVNYIHDAPYFLDDPLDPQHPPMERFVGIYPSSAAERPVLVALSHLREKGEIRVETADGLRVFQFVPGATAALEKAVIAESRREGSGIVLDENGKLVPHMDSLWFAWLTFHPKSDVRLASDNK